MVGQGNLRVRTDPAPIRIYTQDFEIEGSAHTKPGGYHSRVTDILNQSNISFIPVTDVRYRLRNAQASEFIEAKCLAVRISSIEVIDLLEEA